MEEKEEETVGNYCASCRSPIPPGVVMCPTCSQVRNAAKRPIENPGRDDKHVSVIRTPEGSVRRGVANGILTKEQGERLLLLLSRRTLLDFFVRSVLASLVKEIAEERHAQKKEDRVNILIEFVRVAMPSDDFANELSQAFKLK